MARMRMMDLFCCEGLGALGYNDTGLFFEIIGVDLSDMSSSYSYKFLHQDVLKIDYTQLEGVGFIHASPPCQGYSKVTPSEKKRLHPRLIRQTHLLCRASGLPYVIENVEGSGIDLRPNLCLSGEDVGLPMKRKRYFYVHGLKQGEKEFKRICAKHFMPIDGKHLSPNGAEYVRKADLMRAYGLWDYTIAATHKYSLYGLEQGIPPRMTQAIANILFGVWA